MAIIKQYENNGCHIIVHDDAIRPPEEVKKIIERASIIVLKNMQAAEMAEREKKTNDRYNRTI